MAMGAFIVLIYTLLHSICIALPEKIRYDHIKSKREDMVESPFSWISAQKKSLGKKKSSAIPDFSLDVREIGLFNEQVSSGI